jgi:heme A synthase
MWLRFDHHAASAEHLTRDGALGVIAGFAALFVLVRRNYARAMTAVVAAGVLLQILLGIIDDHDHHVEISFELLHVLIIGILVLLVLAWPRFVNLSTQNSNAKK